MLTEDEAKKKWCPFVRLGVEGSGPPLPAANRVRDPDGNLVANPTASRCIASECMAWGWMPEEFEETGEKCATAKFTDKPVPVEGFEWVYASHGRDNTVNWKQVKRLRRKGFCALATNTQG